MTVEDHAEPSTRPRRGSHPELSVPRSLDIDDDLPTVLVDEASQRWKIAYVPINELLKSTVSMKIPPLRGRAKQALENPGAWPRKKAFEGGTGRRSAESRRSGAVNWPTCWPPAVSRSRSRRAGIDDLMGIDGIDRKG